MNTTFDMDRTKDIKMIGKTFVLKNAGENDIDLNGKLIDIDQEGYYVFKITSTNTDFMEMLIKDPNTMVVLK